MQNSKSTYQPVATYILIFINVFVFVLFSIFIFDKHSDIDTFHCIRETSPYCMQEVRMSQKVVDCVQDKKNDSLDSISCHYDLNYCYKYNDVINECTPQDIQFFYRLGTGSIDNLNITTIHTLITSMFVHVNLWHLFLNISFLLFVGSFIESQLGIKKFLILYFLSGILASLIAMILFTSVDKLNVGIGASGAIYGLLGANLALNFYKKRNDKVAIIFNYFYTQGFGMILLTLIFISQILYSLSADIDEFTNIVHIAGCLSGFIITLAFIKKK